MQQVCAWCGKNLGEVDAAPNSQSLITHGVCKECAHHLFAQMGMPLQEYLDGLEPPIVVVDASGTVRTANARARSLLHKDLGMIEGYKGGDVFECEYAKLPEGCGQTIHCSGCTIRRTVMETFNAGGSRGRVPAYLNHAAPGGIEKINLLISTEKVGDVVLLRIDAMGDQVL